MAIIKVQFIDQVYMRVESDLKVEKHIAKFFSFPTEQARFRKNNREWDGVWRLYYGSDRKLLAGLYPRLEEFANEHGHKIEKHNPIGKDEDWFAPSFRLTTRINEGEFRKWLDGLRYESSKPQEHEATAMLNVLKRNRAIVRLSGNKHPVLYYLLQWFLKEGKKCLLIVWDPETVKRMYERFESRHIQKLYNRLTKNVKKPILIASWQSVYRQPEEWFDQFDAVIVDEIDKFPAKSSGPRTVIIENYFKPVTKNTPQLQTLMEKVMQAEHRIGVTEWNGESKIHRMVLEGLFGTVEEIRNEATAKEVQSSLHVTRIELNYPKDVRKQANNWKREQEIGFLEQHEGRNRYIRNLACALDGNTLVIVKKLSHCTLLYNSICEKLEGNELKKEVCMNSKPTGNEWILIATYQKIHYGLHVDYLDYVILSHPYKNDIRGMKSMGSNLKARNAACNLYDIVDDLGLENWENHLMKEANRRLKVYREQKLSVKRVPVDIKC